jgi:hypothetical protein
VCNVCSANACAAENAATGHVVQRLSGVACDGHGSCVALDSVRDGDETDVEWRSKLRRLRQRPRASAPIARPDLLEQQMHLAREARL